ncbi:transglycosylase SLT domain-containing protein [Nitrobacteraceae bacterium UC4446_H13]
MAGGAPVYEQQLDAPSAPTSTIAPIHAEVPSAAGAWNVFSAAAKSVQEFADKKYAADQNASSNLAQASAIEELQKAQLQSVKDPDYENAPKNFTAARDKIIGDALVNVTDPEVQSKLQLRLTTAAISAQGKVDAAAVKRQNDAATAGLDTSTQDMQQRAAMAGSPTERRALTDASHSAIDDAVAAGTISPTDGVKRKRLFDHGLSSADIARSIEINPSAAMQALDDPNSYPGLTPAERQSYRAQAMAAHDEQNRLRAGDLAKRDPALAAARYGSLTSRTLADQIFSRVIVPIESSGNPNVVSTAGALGLGQLMPDTARDVAWQLGMKDVADLDAGALKQRLLSDTALNVRLGSTYWHQQLTRYNGNTYAAAAAYNAGPGRADKWDAQARQQFGDHYSPAQLASVIPIAETRDYVLKVARGLGVDVGAPAVSFRGSYGAAAAVDQQLAQQLNEQKRQDRELISLTQPDRDSVAEIFRNGYAVDPLAVQRAKQPLVEAAARGDVDATVKLRKFEDAEATYPLVVEAYKHTPEQVEAAASTLRAALATRPGTPDDMRRLDVLEKVAGEMATARKDNPVGLLERQLGPSSVSHIAPPQNPADPSFVGEVAARGVTAAQANAAYGGELRFFKPEERAALKPWFAALPPEGQAAAIGTLAQATGGRGFAAAVKEITDGKPATMYAAGLFASAPEIASSIIAGSAAVDKYVPHAAAAKLSYTTEKSRGLPLEAFNKASRLSPTGAFAAMSDAIDARYAYLAAQAHDDSGEPNTQRLRQATDDVTGGILSMNGAKVLAPWRGATQQQFDDAVWSFSDKDLAGMRTAGGKAVSADFLRGSAKLQAFGDGTYLVQLNRDDANPQYAARVDGSPYVLDLRNRPKGARALPSDPRARINAPFVAATERYLQE